MKLNYKFSKINVFESRTLPTLTKVVKMQRHNIVIEFFFIISKNKRVKCTLSSQ